MIKFAFEKYLALLIKNIFFKTIKKDEKDKRKRKDLFC